jgi:hypothetical protein
LAISAKIGSTPLPTVNTLIAEKMPFGAHQSPSANGFWISACLPRLRPGNVVIQRGTNHAWQAHGGPALFLAVLIDRELARE